MAIKFLNTATAATQAVGDNSTKIATTAYADAAAAAIPIGNYLPLTAGSTKPLTGDLFINKTNPGIRLKSGSQDVAWLGDFGGGTDGQLVLFDNAGNSQVVLNGQANSYFNGGNVGIGEANPSRKLEVRASSEGSDGGIVLTDFTNGTSMVARLQDSSTGGRLYLKTDTDVDGIVLNAGGDSYFNNGNVGIGTDSPAAKLDVQSSTSSAYFRLKRAYTGSESALFFASESTTNFIDSQGATASAAKPFVFKTGGTERMRIYSNGLVRVGPNVNNAYTFDTYLQTRNLLVAGFSGTGESNIYLHRDDQTISNGNILGNLNFSGQDGASNIGAVISGVSDGSFSAGSAASSLVFKTTPSGSVTPEERMRINSQGIVSISNGTPTFVLANSDNSLIANQIIGDINFSQSDPSGNGVGVVSKIRSINSSSFQGQAGLSFHTGTATTLEERMRIDSAGNVGIGTTSPSFQLSIENHATTTSTATLEIDGKRTNGTDGPVGELIFSNNGDTFATVAGVRDNADNKGSLQFQTQDSTFATRMTISSEGNVGIGTTSPDVKLDVRGSTTSDSGRIALQNSDGSVFTQIYSGHSGDNPWFGWKTGTDLRFAVSTNLAGSGFSEKMRILANGNVGIGTTSPNTNLEIGAATNVAPKLRLTLNDSGNSIGVGQEYAGIQWKGNDGQGDGVRADIRVFGEGTSGETYMAFGTMTSGTSASTNAVERMRINSAGNVGIGTTTPTTRLNTVVSANTDKMVLGTASGGFKVGNTTGNEYGINMGVSNSGASWIQVGRTDGTATAYNLSLQAAGGNVGIGTTAPGVKLEVDTAAQSAIMLRARYNANYYTDYGSNQINFTGSNQSYGIKNNGTFALFINSSSNVGIGTTSPGYKLDVNGDIRARDNIRVFGNSVSPPTYNAPTETSVNLGTYISDYAYIDLASTNAGGSWVDFSKANGTDYAGRIRYVNSSDQFQISTNGSQKMVIESGGNVGIGTTSPLTKLHIADANAIVRIEATTSGQNCSTWYKANGNNQWETGCNIASGTDYQIYDRFNSASRMVVGHNGNVTIPGNVGIGTTSPAAKLEVNGDILLGATDKIGWRYSSGNTPYNFITGVDQILTLTGGTWTSSATQTAVRIKTIQGEKVTVKNSGNVGIGTTSPGAKLDVAGGTAGDIILKLQRNNVASYDFFVSDAGAGAAQMFQRANTTNTGFIFQTRNSSSAFVNSLTIAPSGNVGIGTTTPGAKLDVVGTSSTSSSGLLKLKSTTQFLSAPGHMIDFIRSNNTIRGFVGMNQYSVTYSTSSDYRLKRNIVPIADSIDRIKKLKPSRFNWDDGPDDYVVDGFIAHEVADVIPEAITGEKDDVDKDNAPVYQSIDQSKIVPLLTAALQEAVARIEALELRINKLEKQ